MTLAERVQAAMQAKGITVGAELARACGVSPASISLILNGQTKSLKGATATKMAAYLNVNPRWLVDGIGQMKESGEEPSQPDPAEKYEFATRVYGAVLSAGNGSTHWEHEEIEGSHAFTRAWLQRKRLKIEMCRVLTIEGDSMLPELRKGFVVLIDLSDCTPIKSGKVYALSVDGEQRIKRLFRQIDGSLLIRSDNPDKAHYPDEVVQPEHLDRVRIIGRKRWHAGDDD